MATVSPTPMVGYGYNRLGRQPSMRPMVRRDSPLSALSNSQGFSASAMPLRNIGIGDDSEDDDLQPPPQLSALGRSVLEQHIPTSPLAKVARPTKIRISRNSTSGSNTPAHDSTTPGAPSLRIRRVGLQGAPVRRARRTPQSEEERDEAPRYDGEVQAPPSVPTHARVASMDQENIPASIQRSKRDGTVLPPSPGSVMKPVGVERIIPIHIDGAPNPAPLAPVSVNTPHRPAPPPPPPKMSTLAVAAPVAGSREASRKKRKPQFLVNGKIYTQIKRLGKGGSSDVYQVMGENAAIYALKRVKLADADAAAIAGYKGEIDLLKKLEKVERVVRIIDYQVEEEKQVLYVVMEVGESDLSRILRMKLDNASPLDPLSSSTTTTPPQPEPKLDINFTRFYWAEMLSCVAQVHDHSIVHSDLKPANFLLVKGQLKLIDFGIANAIDIENTVNVHRDSHVGTPNYMSPESLQDSSTRPSDADGGTPVGMGKFMKLGKPSDVWSLGCILYQMVYGRPPFAHIPNPIHRVMAIINPAVTITYPPTGIGGVKIPPELRRTLKSCLQRDPSVRPTTHQLLGEKDPFLRPEAASDDLRISQDLLGQIIWRVAERFRDEKKGRPGDDEIKNYAQSFYAKIREWADEGA